jgi:BASS family bile acid:Na+ symporter
MMVSIVKMVIIPISSGLLVHSFLEHMGKVNPVYSSIYTVIMAILPKLSMFVIAFACAIMAANARDQMLVGTIVFSVLISVVVHNILGLLLGYWGARLFHLGERECRTISIEVGLQNSGMAAGLAMSVFKSELAAIPGVIYSSWHNITGALLASWWRNKPVDR